MEIKKTLEKQYLTQFMNIITEIDEKYDEKTEYEYFKSYLQEKKDNLYCKLIIINMEIEDLKLQNKLKEDEEMAKTLSNDIGKSNNIRDISRLKIYNNSKLKDALNNNCAICFDDISLQNIVVLDCDHYFCEPCIKKYIETNIKDRKLNIKCPECKVYISNTLIKMIINKHIFIKYENFLLENTLAMDKDCKFCPRPGCGMAMYSLDNNPMKKCPKCDHNFCFNCETTEWHEGVTCKKYQKWKKENSEVDKSFDKYLKRKLVKKCPRCNVNIEKNKGCDHVHCSNCNHHFYWSNMKPLKKERYPINDLIKHKK